MIYIIILATRGLKIIKNKIKKNHFVYDIEDLELN